MCRIYMVVHFSSERATAFIVVQPESSSHSKPATKRLIIVKGWLVLPPPPNMCRPWEVLLWANIRPCLWREALCLRRHWRKANLNSPATAVGLTLTSDDSGFWVLIPQGASLSEWLGSMQFLPHVFLAAFGGLAIQSSRA